MYAIETARRKESAQFFYVEIYKQTYIYCDGVFCAGKEKGEALAVQ